MKFGELPVAEAEGAILAHSVRHGSGMFKKGRVLSLADIVCSSICRRRQGFCCTACSG